MSIFTKKYAKDWLWVLTAITAVFGVVIFPGLSDFANQSFWWKFWDVLTGICAITVIAGWVYFWTSQSKRSD